MPAKRNPPPAPQQPPRLVVPRTEAAEKIQAHIDKGRGLRDQFIQNRDELDEAEMTMWRWSDRTQSLLVGLFDNSSVADSARMIPMGGISDTTPLQQGIELLKMDWRYRLNAVQSVLEQLDDYEAPPPPEPRQTETPPGGIVQAMESPPQLTTDQQTFLQTVFDYFHEHGEWPTYRHVDLTLYRKGINAKAIFERLRPALAYGTHLPKWNITDEASLTVPLLFPCTGSEEELAAFIRVLRLCIERELKGDEPKVSSAELLADGQYSELVVQKVRKLFQREPYLVASGGDQGWDLGIIPEIAREYRSIGTLEEYLATRPNLLPDLKYLRQAVRTYIRDVPEDEQPATSMGGSVIPVEITESLVRFQKDYPDTGKTAFIMMRFSKSKAHQEIAAAIRATLKPLGLTAVRADDKHYHGDLYWNVLTYMHGCGFGIAVYDRIEEDNYNPNVALEVGYMMALRKPVCLLKDKNLPGLQADLVGKLYQPFDPQDINKTVDKELAKWIADHDLTEQVS